MGWKWVVMLVLCCSLVYAADCGYNVKDCECGDRLIADYTMSSDISCASNGISFGAHDIFLDCNGHSIIGSNTSYGVTVATHRIKVKNCKISGFQQGIRQYGAPSGGKYLNNELYGNSYGVYGSPTYGSDNGPYKNEYINNDLHDNVYGMALHSSRYNNITSNYFYDNDNGLSLYFETWYNNVSENTFLKNDVSLSSSFSTVAKNVFIDSSLRYSYSDNSFCVDGEPNLYFNGTGPSRCDCIDALEYLRIKGNATLCRKEYKLRYGISVLSGSVVDCNGASLVGIGGDEGIYIGEGQSDVLVKNCDIRNFTEGVDLYSYAYRNKVYNNSISWCDYGIRTEGKYSYGTGGKYNVFSQNKIFNNNNGVNLHSYDFTNITDNEIYGNQNGITSYGEDNHFFGNILFNKNYDIYAGDGYNISAWENSFYDVSIYDFYDNAGRGYVLYEPYFSIKDTAVIKDIRFEDEVIARLEGVGKGTAYFIHMDSSKNVKNITNRSVFVYDEDEVSVDLDLKDKDYVRVIYGNSSLEKQYRDIKVFVGASGVVGDYIKDKLDLRFTGISDADIILVVGEDRKIDGMPYTGYIKVEDDHIFIMGKRIEGKIAAVKRFVSEYYDFIYADDKYVIVEDVGVFDFMHTPANEVYFGDEEIIRKALYGMYDHFTFTVENHRMERIVPAHTEGYLEFVDAGNPVVFAGGIFSDINAWYEDEGLAKQMADDNKEVWLIELTGGPSIECSTCYDYTYDDIVDSYFPAIMGKISEFSDKVDYVGHSNGARVALSALSKYPSMMPKVDRFVGVACPATLNENTGSSNLARELKNGIPKGDIAIQKIRDSDIKHVYRQDYGRYLNYWGNFFGKTNTKISTNLMDFYNILSIQTNNTWIFTPNIVTKTILFAGNKGVFGLTHYNGDGVVPISDLMIINESLDNSELYIIKNNHVGIINDKKLKTIIRGELNEKN